MQGRHDLTKTAGETIVKVLRNGGSPLSIHTISISGMVIAQVEIAFQPLNSASKLVNTTSPQIRDNHPPRHNGNAEEGEEIIPLSPNIFRNSRRFMKCQISSNSQPAAFKERNKYTVCLRYL